MPKINENKLCLTDLLKAVSHKSGVSLSVVRSVYDSMVDITVENLIEGRRVGMTGFGSFYIQDHKGHPVQFNNTKKSIDDYKVVKFVASGLVKKGLNGEG